MTNYTPGPWIVDEFYETGGYDCMFASIEVGPVTLDGSHYGQDPNIPMTDEQKSRMIADAHLISSVHDLLKQRNELALEVHEWRKKLLHGYHHQMLKNN